MFMFAMFLSAWILLFFFFREDYRRKVYDDSDGDNDSGSSKARRDSGTSITSPLFANAS